MNPRTRKNRQGIAAIAVIGILAAAALVMGVGSAVALGAFHMGQQPPQPAYPQQPNIHVRVHPGDSEDGGPLAPDSEDSNDPTAPSTDVAETDEGGAPGAPETGGESSSDGQSGADAATSGASAGDTTSDLTAASVAAAREAAAREGGPATIREYVYRPGANGRYELAETRELGTATEMPSYDL